MRYAELQVTTHFSFLRGASSAEELFATAKLMGIEALGVVDRNSLAGIVRARWRRRAPRACGWSSAAGSICRTACRSSFIRPIALPIRG
ncbi:hypothetical protein JOH52_005994 [Sinorhizobium meliloti]|uniref:DnaE3 putative DNA polymerase III alpha chain n=1 Tax=Sinorhizobium meliloti (strain SM11) TaxID=707241 RepID=F7XF10_SINMM|nr:DnaE3 putative DNA polymerase III alpha chain [Sinorhizobium meliloti SM11]MBP2469902.1 hypothetical protein [Sinorhizobium meliloti]GEC41392.1 hypothetical protein EME01_54640 [Sinorhizobium meliloti]